MKLKEIGEFGFIERFTPCFSGLLKDGFVGIGDDCAVLPASDREDWLVTTDLLMEDVHFLRNEITPEQLGYKSLAVNLSDIAAMGGAPVASFLSIAVPADLDVEYLDAFMNGYQQLSVKYDTPLLGGDTTKSLKHLAINVCVIGKCPKGAARFRKMAKPGDAVCVTGFLGDSAGGLQALLHQQKFSDESKYLISRHHLPEPRIHEGLFLSGFSSVHAMMDISDGIASDLKHILKASGVSANIHLERLPVTPQLTIASKNYGWNIFELAAAGGEDYELLVTIAGDQYESIEKEFMKTFGKPLVKIGSIIEGEPVINWFHQNSKTEFLMGGFNHFE